MKQAAKHLAWVSILLLMAGCQIKKSDRYTERCYFFGVTVVTMPKSAPQVPDFAAKEASNLGLRIGGGSFGLGFNRIKEVSLPPDGAIYLEVQTQEQFEEAKKLIALYPNKPLCVTQKTTKPSLALKSQ